MNEELSSATLAKEEVILRTVKTVLTDVIRETAVRSGMPHPLSAATRDEIRRCFVLITDRERELAIVAGRPQVERPYFKDEVGQTTEVVVPITSIKRSQPN